ncbi:hypothetical protein ACWENQ_37875 [Nonomuraea sp. NPDC004354]
MAALSWNAPLRVLVLDDAARPEAERQACEHAFDYDSRPDRGHLK